MKIKILMIGKTDESYLDEGINKYMRRLEHYINIEWLLIADVKSGGKMADEKLKEEEGKIFLSKLQPNDFVVLLDEHGKSFTSKEFSAYLQKRMNASVSTLIFVIGGAFGFSQAMFDRANDKISLSKMTFSHQMVRLFFSEQLYRSFTILNGEKYHHN